MAELARIPAVTAYHIPTSTSEPIKLAQGDLLLTSLPPDGLNPTERLTLSVAHISFPITPTTPIGKTDSINQHASYAFLPALPTAAGTSELPTQAAFGRVKLVMTDSTSPASYEAAEEFARKFEEVLKEKKVYKEAGYYDIEDEGKRSGQPASYGTVLGSTLSSYGRFFAGKFQGLTDNTGRAPPPPESFKTLTKNLSIAAETVTKAVQDVAAGAKDLVKDVRGEEARPATQTVQQQVVLPVAEDPWQEVKIGAAGVAEVAVVKQAFAQMMSTPASRTPAAKSYRPAGYNMSPGLKRARMPFAVRNGITGGSILVFIAGVYYYSISAVKQDDFADVQDLLPSPAARASIKTIEEELSEKKARGPVVYTPAPVGTPNSTTISSSEAGPSSLGGLGGGFMSGADGERPISGVTTAIEREAKAFASEAKSIGKSMLSLSTSPSSPSPSSPATSSASAATRSSIEDQMHLFRVPVFSGRTGSWIGTREVNVDRLGGMGLFGTKGTENKAQAESPAGKRLV